MLPIVRDMVVPPEMPLRVPTRKAWRNYTLIYENPQASKIANLRRRCYLLYEG
jgi:hypothetical protein